MMPEDIEFRPTLHSRMLIHPWDFLTLQTLPRQKKLFALMVYGVTHGEDPEQIRLNREAVEKMDLAISQCLMRAAGSVKLHARLSKSRQYWTDAKSVLM